MISFPTVSVVVPNYNHAHFLEEAIRQHLSQTVLPLEIIIVDDGSTDESPALISKLAEKSPLIRPLYLTKNQGVNEANNKGLIMARGEYVFFSAADDLVSPHFLENSLKILSCYSQAAFSFCDPAEYILKKRKKLHYPLFLSNQPCFFSQEKILSLLKKRYFTFPSNTVLFKKKYIEEIGGFFPSLERGADWFACFTLALHHGVCYLPMNLAWFCIRDDSYSAIGVRSTKKQRTTHYKIVDLVNRDKELQKRFREAGILYEYSWRSLGWILFHKESRKMATFKMFKKIFIRSLWGYIRPYVPHFARVLLRKLGLLLS